jgi:flagellar hook assembly protein FlgD
LGYQAGDEFINVDSINTIYLNTEQANLPPSEITVYPNPFDNTIAIEYNLTENAYVSLFIYDMNGRVVNKLYRGEQTPGQQQIIWNGTNDLGVEVSNGIYNYSMLIDGKPYLGRMIKN